MSRQELTLFDRQLIGPALFESVKKLDPRVQWRNPVMFVVYIGTILTAALYAQALTGRGEASPAFILAVTVWLAFTVLFANFAEAHGRGTQHARRPPRCAACAETVFAEKAPTPTCAGGR